MKEDAHEIILDKEDQEKMTPYIVTGESRLDSTFFYILADNVKICSTNNMLKALKLLVATFFVFNIAYPKRVHAALIFFQKIFLNLHDSSKTAVSGCQKL